MQKLLLLHGALGSAANFIGMKELLADRYEIHTLNFESHGGRETVSKISIPAFAKEVVVYLDQNGIDKISIFGYSMGGYVGLYLARHYPERIERLFTLATKLNWTPQGAAKESAMLNSEMIKMKVPKYAAVLEQLHGKNWEALLNVTADMMLDLGANPVLKPADFPQITIPVLLSVGDKDVMVSIEETVSVYRLLPQAQLTIFPNTVHPIDRVNEVELAHQIRNYFL